MRFIKCFFLFSLFSLLFSCGGESAKEVAARWCDVKKKEKRAKTEEEKMMLHKQADSLEQAIEEEYRNDAEMRREIKNEVMACEEELEKILGEEYEDFDGD
ncbi:MAG: hypothetical protein ACHQF2_02080 [Flavobacteriales bacterium]